MTITTNDMQNKLLSVEDFTKVLQTTENLGSQVMTMDGNDSILFSLPSGWNIGLKDKKSQDLTDAVLATAGKEFMLTKEAILGITHSIGLSPSYVAKTPGVLIQSHLNYWATHSPDIGLKMLTKDGDKVLAVTKESIKPFSNIELLDRTLQSIYETYGLEESSLYVDYKSYHDLHTMNLRIIIPEESRQIDSNRGGVNAEDMWSAGVQIRNSLTGKFPLTVQAYLFAWYCTNGAIMQHSAGKYNRKVMGQDEFEVYEWVKDSVDDVLATIEHEFDIVSSLTEESVKDSVAPVLADIFKTYKIPLRVRQDVTDNLIASEDYTYYGVMNAITKTANSADLPDNFVTSILEIGGAVATDASHRCSSCKRVLV